MPDFPNAFCTHCFALHDEGSPLPFLKYLPVLCFHNLCLTDDLTFRLECYKDVICSFVWYFFCKSMHSSSGMKGQIKKHHRQQINLLYMYIFVCVVWNSFLLTSLTFCPFVYLYVHYHYLKIQSIVI